MGLTQADFEYKGDDVKTKANRIHEDDGAFFTVGDVGELDDDGYLFLRDRKIDMIISGGVNIYPSEIEGAFLSNPAVGDVAVFGVPNDDWGEEVKAVIEPAAGRIADDAFEAELRTWAEANLASYKRPRSYDFTDRDAPRVHRQAVQAQAPRSLLGRPRPDLTVRATGGGDGRRCPSRCAPSRSRRRPRSTTRGTRTTRGRGPG